MPGGRLSIRKIGKIHLNLQFFANFWRARSRLHQNEILEENNSKYAFESAFQSLQDLHICAPLQSQNLEQKSGLKNQQFL